MNLNCTHEVCGVAMHFFVIGKDAMLTTEMLFSPKIEDFCISFY